MTLSPKEVNMLALNPQLRARLEQIDPSPKFMEYLKKPLRRSIRVNTLKLGLDEIVEELSKRHKLEQVSWCKEGFFIDEEDVGNTLEYNLGLIYSQEASSMIPAIALNLEPGMLVLDMAASPGSKTTQIAQYMRNEGCIIANDVRKRRINVMISNFRQFGVLIARVTIRDGRGFKEMENTFDRILVDAPCSNTGMIRKNYKYAKIWTKRDVESLSRLQKSMLTAAYSALKPGGKLVYSTCSFDPVENEEVVDHLLSNTDAKLEGIDLEVESHRPILKFDGKEFDPMVEKCLRIHPQDNDTEGFFVAKVVK
ncbi:MAG: NOL1/NOP2/sun family putative RNA methylase [Archaeoglobaceae archaeon]